MQFLGIWRLHSAPHLLTFGVHISDCQLILMYYLDLQSSAQKSMQFSSHYASMARFSWLQLLILFKGYPCRSAYLGKSLSVFTSIAASLLPLLGGLCFNHFSSFCCIVQWLEYLYWLLQFHCLIQSGHKSRLKQQSVPFVFMYVQWCGGKVPGVIINPLNCLKILIF